jgi:hypothetical protein
MDRISKEGLEIYFLSHKHKIWAGILAPITEETLKDIFTNVTPDAKQYVVLHPNNPSSDLYFTLDTSERQLVTVMPSFLLLGYGAGSLTVMSPHLSYRRSIDAKAIEISCMPRNNRLFQEVMITFADPQLLIRQKDELVSVNVCVRAIDSDIYTLT